MFTTFSAILADAASIILPSSWAAPLPSFAALSNSSIIIFRLLIKKAGGIIGCNSPLEVAQATDKLLGKKLVTNQTGPEGKIVNRIYIEEASDIEKELYLGLVFDRSSESIMVVASTEGGMSVEEIAKEKPETIIRSKIEVAVGMQNFQARELAFGLGIEPVSYTHLTLPTILLV